MKSLSRIYRFIESVTYNFGSTISLTAMTVCFLFLWFPIAILVFMSFAKGGVLSFPPQELTLAWYGKFLHNDTARESIYTSLELALPVTAVGLLLSTLLAYGLDRYSFRGQSLVQASVVLPMIVPIVIIGLAMSLFYGIIGISGGYWTVFSAHVILTIPFTTLIILSTLSSFDRTLEEASKDLGANNIETFIGVTLPNILPGIIAGGLLAFTTSFNEFVATYFLKSSGFQTFPVYVWDRVRRGVTPEVNVISVVFIFTAISLVLLAVALTRVERVTGP